MSNSEKTSLLVVAENLVKALELLVENKLELELVKEELRNVKGESENA